jgi:radical SAM protein with 4Fe4S-binding SPASM domain
VINRYNYGSLERTVALSRQLGVDGLSFSPFKAWGPEMAEAALTLAEEKAVGRTLRRLRRQAQGTLPRLDVDQALMAYRFARTAETAPPCYVGFTNIRIRVDGTVVPCQSCNLIMGHAGEAGLKEIWNGPQYREFRRQTRSRAGLAALAPSCDCSYCCSTRNNVRIHRFFRWLAPFSRGVRT